MKTIVKSIVVILLFSVSLSAQSQENEDTVLRNHPHFMVDGVRWFEIYHDMFLEDEGITLSTSSFFDVSQYEIHGDSIVDGKEYKIIESTFYIHYGNGDVFEKKGPSKGAFFVREDSLGNVFFSFPSYPATRKERFVVKYTQPWAIGDTMRFSYSGHTQIHESCIESVDEITLLDGKTYLVANDWIYGVGHLIGGPFACHYEYDDSHGKSDFLEYYHGDTLVYENKRMKEYLLEMAKFKGVDMSGYEGDPIFTDIQSVNKDDSFFPFRQDDCIFDLQGRQLRRKPEKGLYIQNEKVRMVR